MSVANPNPIRFIQAERPREPVVLHAYASIGTFYNPQFKGSEDEYYQIDLTDDEFESMWGYIRKDSADGSFDDEFIDIVSFEHPYFVTGE
jgi:hypothetical protein